jgi:hypothetical protein
MPDEKALRLFREIQTKTREARIPWEVTADEYVFVAAVKGKYVFEFRPYTFVDQLDGEPHGYPSIAFKDAERELMVLSNRTLSGVPGPEIEELYQLAKRQALRVDEKIDEALDDIGEL